MQKHHIERHLTLLVFGAFALRLLYLVYLCPLELAGDEAYYWVQAKHLAWSYREKGPLLAWMIALCCRIFGDHEWAVRLPVLISWLIATLSIWRLTRRVTRGDRIAEGFAVGLFMLIPAFLANSQISTQDGVLIAMLVLLTDVGLTLADRWEDSTSMITAAALMGFLLGLGVLLKQSTLLFVISFPIYWCFRRQKLRICSRVVLAALTGTVVFMLTITPMILWEHAHGWPLLEHTMGHLGFAGDRAGWKPKGNRLLWILNTTGSLFGAIGPAMLLMIWASFQVTRQNRDDDHAARSHLWLLCAAWPGVLFFVLLSLIKPVVPSWPLPSTVPLVVTAACILAKHSNAYAILLDSWNQQKRTGGHAKKPRSGMIGLWHATIVYGLVALVIMSFPRLLVKLPWIGRLAEKSLLARVSGSQTTARQVAEALADLQARGQAPRWIATSSYQRSSLLEFYLKSPHPPVTSASGLFGVRKTNFDSWPETRLDTAESFGSDMLIVDANAADWAQYMGFSRIEPIRPELNLYLGIDFRGPLPGAAVQRSPERRRK